MHVNQHTIATERYARCIGISRRVRRDIERHENPSALFKDVFLYHRKEESQHAIMDEMEWLRENRKLDAQARDRAVDELIELVGAVDGLLQPQAGADVNYFLSIRGRGFEERQVERIRKGVPGAYRWQYIVSGVQLPRFQEVLGSMITPEQASRIEAALAPILN